jgi:hypothetical protein
MFEFNGTARNFGRQLALGFIDVAVLCVLIMFVVSLVLQTIMPTDDCDRGRFDRCGMRVLTDEKTGQQYLVTSKGGIIERKSQ